MKLTYLTTGSTTPSPLPMFAAPAFLFAEPLSDMEAIAEPFPGIEVMADDEPVEDNGTCFESNWKKQITVGMGLPCSSFEVNRYFPTRSGLAGGLAPGVRKVSVK